MNWRAMGGPGSAGASGDWATSEAYGVEITSDFTGQKYFVGASYVVDPGPWNQPPISQHAGLYRMGLSPPFNGTNPGTDIRKTLSRPVELDLLEAAILDLTWMYYNDRPQYEKLSRMFTYNYTEFTTHWGSWIRVNMYDAGPQADKRPPDSWDWDSARAYQIILPPYLGYPPFTASYFCNGGVGEFSRNARDSIYRPDDPSDNLMQPYGKSKFWFLFNVDKEIPPAGSTHIWSDSPGYDVYVGNTWDDVTLYPSCGRTNAQIKGTPLENLTKAPGGRIQYRRPGWAFSR